MAEDVQLVEQRQSWLLDRVATQRRVTTTEAASELRVSVDTIRRDLRHLHERGLVRRVHGGAVPVARLANSFAERAVEASGSAAALAAEVIRQFRPGQLIGLDGGTTSVAIAGMIPAGLSITVVTNNPAAAVALGDHPSATVILLGGHLDLTWMTATGADTVDGWREHRLDIGVLGVCGLDVELGATTNSPHEVATKRALIASSSEVIVPVHHDKIGVQASFVVAGLDAIDLVISEMSLPTELRLACSRHRTEAVTTGDGGSGELVPQTAR